MSNEAPVGDIVERDRLVRRAMWGVVAIALAVRGFGALVHPVDQDELYTVAESRDLYRTTLAPGIQSRPLYYLLQHLLFEVLPAHEPWTRLLPVIFGVMTIVLIFHIARRLSDDVGGIVAAAIAALSPWHIYASEMARYYSLVGLLIVATIYLTLEAREYATTRAWRRASVPVAIGLLVHPTFALGVAVLLFVAVFRRASDAPRWQLPSVDFWRGFVPAVSVSAGLLVYSIVNLGPRRGFTNGGARFDAANQRLFLAILEWASPTLCVAGFLGLSMLCWHPKRERDREPGRILLAGTVSTLLFVLLASRVTATYADYAIGILPGLFIGTGVLTARVAAGSIPRAAAIGAILLASAAPSLASHVIDGTRFDYRPALAYVREVSPRSLVLTWPIVTSKHYASDLRMTDLTKSTKALDELLAAEQQIFAIVSFKRYGFAVNGGPQIGEWIRNHCAEQRSFERSRFDYRQYRVSVQLCTAHTLPGAASSRSPIAVGLDRRLPVHESESDGPPLDTKEQDR